ncbi:hypothetical protein AX774_g768 [Zancudomyces culisetae]|uniref:Uncharacterized protein n=1 Tax=Zancudomyces culisetae TaxID=1213189 RepID=A0A1R1PXL0_ZANCU|nr:hypothetical protein AX774_g768 [Zancudomyces culisetae]|eukprot:OMH85689.1 hypothetical protein AX774_g768 [Zancudomyces culisetae]
MASGAVARKGTGRFYEDLTSDTAGAPVEEIKNGTYRSLTLKVNGSRNRIYSDNNDAYNSGGNNNDSSNSHNNIYNSEFESLHGDANIQFERKNIGSTPQPFDEDLCDNRVYKVNANSTRGLKQQSKSLCRELKKPLPEIPDLNSLNKSLYNINKLTSTSNEIKKKETKEAGLSFNETMMKNDMEKYMEKYKDIFEPGYINELNKSYTSLKNDTKKAAKDHENDENKYIRREQTYVKNEVKRRTRTHKTNENNSVLNDKESRKKTERKSVNKEEKEVDDEIDRTGAEMIVKRNKSIVSDAKSINYKKINEYRRQSMIKMYKVKYENTATKNQPDPFGNLPEENNNGGDKDKDKDGPFASKSSTKGKSIKLNRSILRLRGTKKKKTRKGGKKSKDGEKKPKVIERRTLNLRNGEYKYKCEITGDKYTFVEETDEKVENVSESEDELYGGNFLIIQNPSFSGVMDVINGATNQLRYRKIPQSSTHYNCTFNRVKDNVVCIDDYSSSTLYSRESVKSIRSNNTINNSDTSVGSMNSMASPFVSNSTIPLSEKDSQVQLNSTSSIYSNSSASSSSTLPAYRSKIKYPVDLLKYPIWDVTRSNDGLSAMYVRDVQKSLKINSSLVLIPDRKGFCYRFRYEDKQIKWIVKNFKGLKLKKIRLYSSIYTIECICDRKIVASAFIDFINFTSPEIEIRESAFKVFRGYEKDKLQSLILFTGIEMLECVASMLM